MFLEKVSEYLQYRVYNRYSLFNPIVQLRKSIEKIYQANDINICYNKFIRSSYDPKKQNILIAIESPAYFEHFNWFDHDMTFIAEISFANFFNLDNYYCPRTIYVNNDNFVNMPQEMPTINKSKLVSMIYSDKQLVEGHKLRHRIAETFGDKMELYGKGSGRLLDAKEDSILPYKFQVVIENGKYPEYVTEKFFDCIKLGTIPIYWGGEKSLRKMGFDMSGVLLFDSLEELEKILNEKVNDELYNHLILYAKYNWERLLEIRKEEKLNLALNSVIFNYHQTIESYKGIMRGKLNLGF